MNYTTYILASEKNGTLYIGCTNNLPRRIWEHKNKLADGFTKKYSIDKLVYYEFHDTPEAMIHREKRLKEWQRNWKIELIEKHNPEWEDLYFSLNN